jgi:uncharacterized membrane protein (UPF0127 family)
MTRTVFGPGPGRLLCDGRVVAAAALADTADARRKGLLGTDAVEGALWITKCPSVHMMGMRYPIDVAVVDRDGVVIKVATLQPWLGATRPRFRATATVEAPAGAMSAWGVGVGSRLVYESAEIVSGH